MFHLVTDKKRKAASKFPPEVKFHDEHFLAQKLGVDRRYFHRHIKPIILADFPEIIREIGSTNPDVGLDAHNNLYYRKHRPQHRNTNRLHYF